MKDTILQKDLDFIANKIFKGGSFSNSTVFITGATGLVGSLLVKSILYANKTLGTNIKVLASVRNLNKARETFLDFISDSCLEFITIDLLEPINILKKIDFIVHAASITASKEMVENPTGVLLTAFDSTKNILNYVKVNPNCKMVYISSMEYYGQVTEGYENATEDKLGYIDLSKPRSCYPESKRACETLCNAYATQYNINVCSARLAQTFGAGVPFSDNRVFAQFAKSAMNNSDIILHTTGESEGNYCYTADAIYAILLLLTNGKKGQSYNVACDHSSIINMAKLVAEKIADNRIKVDIQIPQDLNNYGYAPTVKLRLNSDKLRALGWEPSTDLEHMFKRMISSWEISIDK
ncbi:TPA: NAD-dependent epimerase/dehydratase family protein [Citrobacter koseri]|nr:NAD-dependent epimerase/dehydratase family protein [Citrobacter koseri]MBE0084189.1 NAD-dependent epimerase/dehydratase family protein [Citrobacter koseri]HAU5604576.1 NAD-dependent epimerase/dehydratase family protein [Citrobacter koseri]